MEQLENKPLTPQQPRQLPMPKAAWLLLGTVYWIWVRVYPAGQLV